MTGAFIVAANQRAAATIVTATFHVHAPCKKLPFPVHNIPVSGCSLVAPSSSGLTACGVGLVIKRSRVRFPDVPPLGATLGKLFTHMCLCSPSSINRYRLRLGVKCTTGAVLGMLAVIRRTLRLAANRRHSSIGLTCGCRCTAALM